MEQLFTLDPSFGTIPDYRRGDDQVYEFGGPGDSYTFVAPSDKIAICVLCLLSGGITGFVFYYPKTAISPPSSFDPDAGDHAIALFGAHDDDPEAAAVGRFMAAYYDEILEALDGILIGDRLARKSFEESIEPLGGDPEAVHKFRVKWEDKRRTSLYDLSKKAAVIRQAMAARKEANIAPYRDFLETFKAQHHGSDKS